VINIKKPDIKLTLLHNFKTARLSADRIGLSKTLSKVVYDLKSIKSQALENTPNLASEEDEDENLHFLNYTAPHNLRFKKNFLSTF
jgi:hypothetical protein